MYILCIIIAWYYSRDTYPYSCSLCYRFISFNFENTKNFVCAIFSRGSSVFFLLVSPLAYNLAYLIIDSIAIIASRPYGMVSYALLIFYCFCCSYQCSGVLVKKLEKCKSLEPEYKRINFWKTTLNFNEVKT